MILLFGAEFTQAWVERNGGSIAPQRGAVRVVEQTKQIRDGREVPV
jgi:hypothetical protein